LVVAETMVGVPLTAHVVALKARPAGSAGLMEQETIAPPEFAGVSVEINEFTG
jgi:hypothetical protein